RLLAAVLKRIEPEVGEFRYFLTRGPDSENAALLTRLGQVEVGHRHSSDRLRCAAKSTRAGVGRTSPRVPGWSGRHPLLGWATVCSGPLLRSDQRQVVGQVGARATGVQPPLGQGVTPRQATCGETHPGHWISLHHVRWGAPSVPRTGYALYRAVRRDPDLHRTSRGDRRQGTKQ